MDRNRRGFLLSAGAAAFTGALSTHDIKVAFIGRGSAVSKNVEYAAQTSGIQVDARRDFGKILADPSIHAIYIASGERQADMTVAACESGKDVWLEGLVLANVNDGLRMLEAARKYRRVVQTGAVHRSSPRVLEARAIIQRGDLGRVTFCRAQGPAGRLIDIVQFIFNEAAPLSVSAQSGPTSRLATCQYPTFVASYESRNGETAHQATFHGTEATLTLCGAATTPRAHTHLAHWANFVACIRTRQLPVADIETAVRTAATSLMAAETQRSL